MYHGQVGHKMGHRGEVNLLEEHVQSQDYAGFTAGCPLDFGYGPSYRCSHFIISPQSQLIPSTQYYTDLIGGGIGAPSIRTGGGNGANVGSSRNDDDFSGPIALGFSLPFYGGSHTNFWANDNGNISFGGGLWSYTPTGPQDVGQPIIGPLFADVDTRDAAAA